MLNQLKAGAVALGLTAATLALASPATASGCGGDAECAYRYAAPVGYHFDVSTAKGYQFKALPREDGSVGIWNAAQRGNRQGVSFVALAHRPPTRIYLGVNDHRQGDTAPASDGLIAWTKRYVTRVEPVSVHKRYGWVQRVTARVSVHGHRLVVMATAIWPKGCYC